MVESEALHDIVRQPGAVWCYSQTAHGVCTLDHHAPDEGLPFRWLHLNLADQRSLRWLDTQSGMPQALLAPLHAGDAAPRFEVMGDVGAGGALALTLQDFERDIGVAMINRIGALYVLMRQGLLITARGRPLRGADLVRNRLEQGPPVENERQALALLLHTHVEGLGALVTDLGAQLLDAETEMLANDHLPDMRELIAARRLSAQLHRLTGGLRGTITRMERDARLPPELALIARDLLPHILGVDADIVAAQHHLRQLRDELDLQAAQRTNENVYLLSVLTALMMPATLVTGFFGMNTGGLPFAQGRYGTVLATLVALLAGAATYWLLRVMGLVRKG